MLKLKTKSMVIAALLIALGIIVPYMSLPVIPIPQVSVTLAAHVPVLLSMFVSPVVAVLTALGTTLGFLIKGVAPVVTMRALSHVIFAVVGALMLKKTKGKLMTDKGFWAKVIIVWLVTMVLHTLCELFMIWILTPTSMVWYASFIFMAHHTVDFIITMVIVSTLKRAKLL